MKQWMRPIFAAMAGLLLTACVSVNWVPESKLLPALNHLAVTVQHDNGLGSGVWIGPNLVLTAKHVLKGWDGIVDDVWIETLEGSLLDAKPIAWESEGEGMINYDWIILEVDMPQDKPRQHYATVDCGERYAGERVVGFGNAHGYTGLLPYLGYIQKVHFKPSALMDQMKAYWSDAILTNMDGAPGVSGGPVFDMDGELIGMMVGAFQDRRAGNFQQITYPVRAIWPLCG